MTVFYTFRVSTMFTAYSELDVRSGFAPVVTGHFHQLSDPGLIDRRERVVPDVIQFFIVRQEAPGIIAAHPQGGLRQIVRAETKKFSIFGDLVGDDCTPWNFDHRADQVIKSNLSFLGDLSSHAADD